MTDPLANGCICQTCASRGVECRGICYSLWEDECDMCLDGHHAADEKGRPTRRYLGQARTPTKPEPTAYPMGRWFGDAGDVS